MDKRIVLVLIIVIIGAGYLFHRSELSKQDSFYKQREVITSLGNDSLKWELKNQKRATAKWMAQYDSLATTIKPAEVIYKTIKAKHDEKISKHASFNHDEHLRYISEWLSKEDSVRQRYGYSIPTISD